MEARSMGRGGKGVVIVDLWSRRPADAPPLDPQTDRRWRVRAWCPITQRYRTKHVLDHQLGDAKAWAEKTHQRMSLELETTGRLSLEKVGAEYVDEIESRGSASQHVDEVRRVVAEAVAAGATDLKLPSFAPKVRQLLKGWQDDARELSPETRYRYLGHLKAVAKYAVLAGRLPRDPLAVVKRPKLPKKSKRTLTVDELHKLVVPGDEPAWLWVALMVYAGLRAKEALSLRWPAIDWQGRRLRVVGKGAKHRAVPLQVELADLLRPRAQLAGYVIASDFRALAYKNQTRWFKRLLRERGCATERRSVHGVRHTWAALMIASGEDRRQVGEWMGHESERTTDGYTRTAGEYRDAVAGWERGAFCLRAPPAPDVKPEAPTATGTGAVVP
jgi:integrase/recombinase XerD